MWLCLDLALHCEHEYKKIDAIIDKVTKHLLMWI